ncbi:MAG TPA: sugar ABC transporter substrate-binding protein [Candidatus Blautia avistercoris]|uniref:ABC transporter substrate-binding protein n=1 Tax=Blautia sp. An249 TaxID=1965603 RepID=UPI000B36FB61|nr:sugar ABC transporter substrate-binding protein [Blautia sp. An249]OUO81111.1 hypothetical protein B5F53_00600 [Blautia sp. An249]HIY18808.1 sugar ABC transporter substrate-binding protein [Candidatus Blautia avistercoris]
MLKKRTKKAIACIMAVLTVGSLAGCGQGEESTQSTSDASADTGEFDWKMCDGQTINILFNEHQYVTPIIEKLGEFEDLTGIKVNHTTIPESNYFDKVSTLLNAKSDELDIFMTGPYQIWEYAKAGYMEDLQPYIDNASKTSEDFDVEDFYPSILNSARWDGVEGHEMGEGSLWGLPMGFESTILVYNKRIFEEHGIEEPKTLEDVYEAAKALQGHSGENTYGMALRGELGWGTIITSYETIYSMWGAKDFEIQDGKLVSCVNSPEAVEMTDWYVKLIQDGGSPTWASATWSSCGGELGAGTAAMMIDATNNVFSQTIPENAAEAENLVTIPIPLPEGKTEDDRVAQLYTWSLAMNSASSHKDAAWLFLQYFSGKEYQNEASVSAKIVNTPRQSSFEQDSYQELLKNSVGFVDTFEATVDTTKMLYIPESYFFEVSQTWCQTLQDLVEGKYSSTQEGMDDLKEKLDEIVSHVDVS